MSVAITLINPQKNKTSRSVKVVVTYCTYIVYNYYSRADVVSLTTLSQLWPLIAITHHFSLDAELFTFTV